MALQSSGPISFADLNSEIGNSAGATLDLESASITLQTPGAPYGMNELYGKSVYVPPPPSPTYSIVGSPTSQDEGLDVDFIITTTNVPNGTVLYWKIVSEPTEPNPVSDADFVGDLTGTVTINNNTAQFYVTIELDGLTEGEEIFVMQLREGSQNGTFLTQSQAIFINDTSTTPPPPPPAALYYEMVACDGGDSVYFYGLSSPTTKVYVTTRGLYFRWNGQPGSSVAGFTPQLTETEFTSCASTGQQV